jgi:DNA polymerase-3 subunit delta
LRLPEGDKGGVFFLFGDDEFRKEDAARALVSRHLDPATRDFNLDLLRCSEVSVEDLASILATPPMMAESRVVVLREVEALAGNSSARDLLLSQVRNPPPGLVLILLAAIPRGSKAKFYTVLKRSAHSAEFPEIGPNDVPGWLMDWTRQKHDHDLTEGAARALAAGAGTNLGVLAQEVEKLLNAVEEGESIDVDTVRRAGTRVPTEDLWEWMDRVGRREFDRALAGLGTLFTQGESGVRLTMVLATHLIRLAVARSGGRQALEEAVPMRQRFLLPRLLEQSRGWNPDELERAILELRRVDRLLKSSSISEDQILEGWLLGLMARGEAAV